MSFEQWMQFFIASLLLLSIVFFSVFFLLLISFLWIFSTVKSHSTEWGKMDFCSWYFIITNREKSLWFGGCTHAMKWDLTLSHQIVLRMPGYRISSWFYYMDLFSQDWEAWCINGPWRTQVCAKKSIQEIRLDTTWKQMWH